jgi:tetratricopeptide (TPR) repeat protein
VPVLRPYYYGQRKWDNYLLDIQESVESAHEEQLGELREQTDQLRRIGDSLQGGFEELRSTFEWGFTLMVERMDAQLDVLSRVAEELVAIHKTLKAPLSTQFNDLFQRGKLHFREQLWDKALNDFLDAEKFQEVHPLLQLKIGQLYLYGNNSQCNVIDLPEAETHLLAAARYAEAKKGTLTGWSELCGQAYFHAAVAAYLIGEDEQTAGRRDAMRSCLDRALAHLAKAAVLWPQFTDIIYTQAKCYALLGQGGDAVGKLELLSDRDRRYFRKLGLDADFEPLLRDAEAVFTRATISPGPRARATEAKIDGVTEALAWAKRATPISKDDLVAIESIERELGSARKCLPTLDVDIDGLAANLSRMRSALEEIARRLFQSNVQSSQQAIKECEQRKRNCESSIEHLKKAMKETSGAGVGWSVGVLAWIVIWISFATIVAASFPRLSRNETFGYVCFFLMLIGSIALGIFASKIRRDSKNRSSRQSLLETTNGIDECVRSLPGLKRQAESWNQEMRGFDAWRAQRPSPPLPPYSGRGDAVLTGT